MSMSTCESCHEAVPSYDTVSVGSLETGYRELCSRCFNETMAAAGGSAFEHVTLEPLEMADASGEAHRFHFRLHHLGDRLSLEAFELKDGAPGGYQFQILGDSEGDIFALLGKLIERMRRALALQHLEESDLGTQVREMTVRGRIDCDPESDSRRPLLVIDGREVSWREFGRMLMTFEGFQFKLEIRDKSEEV